MMKQVNVEESSVRLDLAEVTDMLLSRRSYTKLMDPGPTEEQWRYIRKAALTAPDHANLCPWRFLEIKGEQRESLGELLYQAQTSTQATPAPDSTLRAKCIAKAKRAPAIIAVIASPKEHKSVPLVEQLLSAGAAAHNILLAAHLLGLGAIWRTGPAAYDDRVKRGLGLKTSEQLVGLIFIGTIASERKPPKSLDPLSFFSPWTGNHHS